MKNKLRVFSIEEFSVYDGPGIRTTVFFKGCPLRCNWCHSPEGQTYDNVSLRSPNGCLHCNECVDICPTGRKDCVGCGKCVDVCPRNLIRLSATDYEVEDLYKELSKNFMILNMNNGGITLSGGEPLSQGEDLVKLIDLINHQTNVAIQTCGYGSSDLFKEIVNKIDLVLYDMKLINKEKALEFEKVDNQLILENFKILKESNTPFIVRIPLIPGVVDVEENINEIINLIKDAKNLVRVELLPYNKYAGSKYKLSGLEYHPMFDENIPSNPHLELFEKCGIEARVL